MYTITIPGEDQPVGQADNLAKAMEIAKLINKFVVIKSDTMEIAGMFGVGDPPEDYEWKKEYSISAKKPKKTWKRDSDERDASQDEDSRA